MRVAIVEDERSVSDYIARLLDSEGYICHSYPTGKSFIAAVKRETFDLVMLDWHLPDLMGPDVMQWVKEHIENPPPILFLTSRDGEEDVILALQAGADDYVVKPPREGELLARVGALLRRRFPVHQPDVQTFGDIRFDTRSSSVTLHGEPIALAPKEFALALVLLQNIDRPLSRAYMLEKVWGRNPDLLTRTLDAHISRVRIKLNLRPEAGYRLLPVYSYGYRLEYFGREA